MVGRLGYGTCQKFVLGVLVALFTELTCNSEISVVSSFLVTTKCGISHAFEEKRLHVLLSQYIISHRDMHFSER